MALQSRFAGLITLAVCAIMFFGCSQDIKPALRVSSDTYRYDIELAQKLDTVSVTASASDTEADTSLDAAESDTENPDTLTEQTVYWVKSGEVWHIKKECSTLARSKSILSGTVDEAKENGKGRVCKICGK